MPLRFIADIHISPITVRALCSAGYDAIRVTEVLPATASDAEILEFARHNNRIVVTQDLDFSALVALNGYDRPSLITLRLTSAQPDEVSVRILGTLSSLASTLSHGVAVTISDKAVRIRQLPMK
jgi:predicted nuclease of predicted toxin-antitoxin system